MKVFAAATGAVVAAAGFAGLRLEIALDAKVGERVDALSGAQEDPTAMTAVAAVRSAERHELLAPKTHAAAPAVAGLHPHRCLVDELHRLMLLGRCTSP